jgi:hypothetical protein
VTELLDDRRLAREQGERGAVKPARLEFGDRSFEGLEIVECGDDFSDGFWSDGFWSGGFWSDGFWPDGFWTDDLWPDGL